jgi:hypothetical protein
MKLSKIMAILIAICSMQSIYSYISVRKPGPVPVPGPGQTVTYQQISPQVTSQQLTYKQQLTNIVNDLVNPALVGRENPWDTESHSPSIGWINKAIEAAKGALLSDSFSTAADCIAFIKDGLEKAHMFWGGERTNTVEDAKKQIEAALKGEKPSTTAAQTTGTGAPGTTTTTTSGEITKTKTEEKKEPTEEDKKMKTFLIALDEIYWDCYSKAPDEQWQEKIATTASDYIIRSMMTLEDAMKKIAETITEFELKNSSRIMYYRCFGNSEAINTAKDNIKKAIKELVEKDKQEKEFAQKNPDKKKALDAIEKAVEDNDKYWKTSYWGSVPPPAWNAKIADVATNFIQAKSITLDDALEPINKLIEEKAQSKGWSIVSGDYYSIGEKLIQEAKDNIKEEIEGELARRDITIEKVTKVSTETKTETAKPSTAEITTETKPTTTAATTAAEKPVEIKSEEKTAETGSELVANDQGLLNTFKRWLNPWMDEFDQNGVGAIKKAKTFASSRSKPALEREIGLSLAEATNREALKLSILTSIKNALRERGNAVENKVEFSDEELDAIVNALET